MALAQKKAIVRRFDGEIAWGYLPQAGLLAVSEVRLMETDGRIKPIALDAVKTICFVRDFNLDDRENPERIGRRSFAARPRGDGLWLRLGLRDGDTLEGVSTFDLGFLDTLAEDHGILLIPPDPRSNTQRIFVPRLGIATVALLGWIQAPSRRLTARRAVPDDAATQPGLFGE